MIQRGITQCYGIKTVRMGGHITSQKRALEHHSPPATKHKSRHFEKKSTSHHLMQKNAHHRDHQHHNLHNKPRWSPLSSHNKRPTHITKSISTTTDNMNTKVRGRQHLIMQQKKTGPKILPKASRHATTHHHMPHKARRNPHQTHLTVSEAPQSALQHTAQQHSTTAQRGTWRLSWRQWSGGVGWPPRTVSSDTLGNST